MSKETKLYVFQILLKRDEGIGLEKENREGRKKPRYSKEKCEVEDCGSGTEVIRPRNWQMSSEVEDGGKKTQWNEL